MREETSFLAAGAGEAMEPSARRAGLLPLRAELSSSAFSFRGGVRPCFPYW
jgi:hypothetical protein